jgi:hypothetical protein
MPPRPTTPTPKQLVRQFARLHRRAPGRRKADHLTEAERVDILAAHLAAVEGAPRMAIDWHRVGPDMVAVLPSEPAVDPRSKKAVERKFTGQPQIYAIMPWPWGDGFVAARLTRFEHADRLVHDLSYLAGAYYGAVAKFADINSAQMVLCTIVPTQSRGYLYEPRVNRCVWVSASGHDYTP